MGLEKLATVSASIAGERARLKKIELLSLFLQDVSPRELPIAVKYLLGELTQGKIGLGAATIRQAWAAAESGANHEFTADLSLTEVDAAFGRIAAVQGKGSQARRVEMLQELLARATETTRSFLARLILGEMRHGALEGLVMEAVAKATGLPPEKIRRAVMLTGDLARVADIASSEGLEGLSEVSMELFRPVQPMLAEPAEDVEDALARLGAAALEYKLDGVRVQVHKQGNQIQVFTRHLKDVTENVPEVVELVRELEFERAILDGEVLALRPDGRPYPFQTTMRRFGRKREIETIRAWLPLSVWFFDCLHADGQSLIDQPTGERHLALADGLPPELIIPRLVTDKLQQASDFLQQAMQAGHEGVMAKSLEAGYSAGGRGQSWLKIKPAHTLDLVILAAEWGSGRRKGWLSNLHLGARDPASGTFAMIGKTFKGLTDKMLSWQTERLLSLETSRDDFTVHVEPKLVAEIAFNEVQRSPHYPSGYALRFARVKRYREDKRPDEADTIATVAGICAQHHP